MIDGIAVKNKLNIEQKANESGYNNLPETNRQTYDTNEQEIITEINTQLNLEKNNRYNLLQSYERQRYDLQSKLEEAIEFGLIEEDIKSDFENYKAKHEGELITKQEEFSRAQRFLAKFKNENKLTRPADYPDSLIFKWSIIMAVFVAEIILNANMFAVGAALGLLGGIFSAAIISIINIGAGVLAGYFILRKINHVDEKQKIYGWISFISYVLLIPIFFNLLVAHYRAELAIDISQAIINAPINLLNGPFSIQNFDSWVLFAVGILVSIIACYEGYTLDDPYPGYGKADRDLREARDKYEDKKARFYDQLDTIVKTGRGKINRRLVDIGKWLSSYKRLIKDSEDEIEEFNSTEIKNAVSVAETLLTKYRDINKQVRNSPPPDYFENLFPKLDEFLIYKLSDTSISPSNHFHERMTRLKETREEDKEHYINEISNLRRNLKNELDQWIKNLAPIQEENSSNA